MLYVEAVYEVAIGYVMFKVDFLLLSNINQSTNIHLLSHLTVGAEQSGSQLAVSVLFLVLEAG